MNGLSEKLSSSYIPEMAIIVYRCETDRSVYLEQRGIENGKMGAGSPLSKSCITNIISALAEDNDEIEKGFHGVIPKTLLYADTTTGKTKLVWYNPPQKRHMFFVERLGIPEGDIIMRALYILPMEMYCQYLLSKVNIRPIVYTTHHSSMFTVTVKFASVLRRRRSRQD